MHALTHRGIAFKVLAGDGAAIDTTTADDKLVFRIFAALAEFERALIVERTRTGLVAARARGRSGGAPFKMTAAKLRLAQAAMGKPETKIAPLCRELGITRQTLYRHVAPDGSLREDGAKLLGRHL
jgi:DNA invertase Pin-like site-specific DNA recombinase